MKVLIAEDDPVFRTLLERHVSKWGYEVVVTQDGTEAWSMLGGDQPPSIAILDWQMPGMDGLEICRRLKKDVNLPFIYTIMLTSRDAPEDIVLGLESGADEYLAKPVDTSMLRTRLTVASRIVEAVPPKEWALPRVPGYEVKRLLGKGTAGSVWEARQTKTLRSVALKIIRLDLVTEEVRARFMRESEIARRLRHDNLARVYDSHANESLCYYVMELIDGKDLGRYVAEVKPSLPEMLTLMTKVCDGMEHAHQQGVVHRDLKPQNILVTSDGEPKVVDFGLAKLMLATEAADESVRTLQGSALGTPMFMSPEQARGQSFEADARCDVYALGVILYLMIIRHHPHKLNTASHWEVMRSIVEGQVRPPSVFQPDIDPRLESIILKALAKQPDQRYPSAGPLGDDLRRVMAESNAPWRTNPQSVEGTDPTHDAG